MNLDSIKNNCLVLDIETWSEYPNGKPIDIRTNFDDYIQYAECKWFGAYSYKNNKGYTFEVNPNFQKIIDLLNEHSILVGFNCTEFDFPILVNNGLIQDTKKFSQVDCMKILGNSTFRDKEGYKYKGRGTLMDKKFKNNSLKSMGEAFGFEVEKGDIDYNLFEKETYTEEERKEITTYLKNDLLITKGLFDNLWEYWSPFTKIIDWKYVLDLSWIKSSIASLIYKSACFMMNTEPTYAESDKVLEEMGGNVYEPPFEEVNGVWSLDFTSLYPHIFCMFGLFSEVEKDYVGKVWHGNKVFQVKGYYDISHEHILATKVKEKIKERIELKEKNPNDPMGYTLKIWLNGLYGIVRSPIFEKVHQPNAGWDVCFLGQQIQSYVEKRLSELGFQNVGGDTDSLFEKAKEDKYNNKEYLQKCLKLILKEINENVPFQVPTFEIKIEKYWKYVLFPFSHEAVIDPETGKNKKIKNRLVKERKGKKKNYLYISENNGKKEITIIGMPIKKDNATPLGMKIYSEVLEPLILERENAKFDREFIDKQINDSLSKKEILELLATEYKIKPAKTYKKESQIQAQISKGYFNGQDGTIKLIKNNKVGKAGKGQLYCTIDEALEAKLTKDELDLEKVNNELEPFCKYQPLTNSE